MAGDGGSIDPGGQGLEVRLAALEARLDDLEDAIVRNGLLIRSEAPSLLRSAEPATPTPAAAPDVPPASSLIRPRPAREADPPHMIWPSDSRGDAGRPTSAQPTLPNLARSLADLEERLTGQALAWVGGVALVLGAIFFLSLAFSRNWIGPEGRVVIGLVAGAAGLAAGAGLLERGNRLLGHVLTPIGLAVISISLVGGTRLYGVIPVQLGLALALAGAAITAVIAIRANSQVVAGFGLVAVLAAPPLLGAAPDLTTLAFVGIALAGTTAIALWRTWSWLPPVAFLLAAPQAASWISGRPNPSIALVASIVFWVLNDVAAGGEEFRRRRNDLSSSSAGLLVVNAAFLVWSGFEVLDGNLEPYRGAFLLFVALAHLALGGYFIARDGDENLFGLLVIGTGIAALTMAAPVQLGAPWVPVSWTAEAVVLAWVAVRHAHVHGAISSALLYLLAAGYVVSLFPFDRAPAAGIPFLNGPGGALAFFLAGVALGVWIVRERGAQSALAALGLVVTAWCAVSELAGPSMTVALAGLAAAAAAIRRFLPRLTERPVAWRLSGFIPSSIFTYSAVRPYILGSLPAALVIVGTAATMHLLLADFGSAWVGSARGIPFADSAGLGLLLFLASLGLVMAFDRDRRRANALVALGTLVLAWACSRELDGLGLVAGWTALALGGLATWSLLPVPEDHRTTLKALLATDSDPQLGPRLFGLALPIAALVNGVLALGHVLVIELPIGMFGQVNPPAVPFSDAGAAAGAILVGATLLSGYMVGDRLSRRISIIGAGTLVAYVVPYEVSAWAVAVLWAGIAVAPVVAARAEAGGARAYLGAAVAMLGATSWVAIGIVAPPSRLVVMPDQVLPIVALQSVAALASLVLALGAFTWLERSKRWTRWAEMATGLAIVYLLSVAVVDRFATRSGGALALEELRKQGQVGLSVTWAISGIVAFVAGLRFRRSEIRQAGLGLLAIAAAKVFLFDLSELDVAYRVVSLVALGVILLLSAGLWQRLQPSRVEKAGNGPGADSAPGDVIDVPDSSH
jgi:uncharacterized membrane protein